MTKPTRQENSRQRREYWQSHIDACQESGMTRTAYCEQKGLNLKTFAYWKHRLKKSINTVKLIQVSSKHGIAMQGHNTSATLKLIVNDRFAVEVSEGFNPTTLVQVVEVVRSL